MYVRILKASSAKHLRKPFHLIPEINNLFIDLLADCLKSNGHTVRESIGDADVDIIPSVLDIACGGKMLFWLDRTQIFSSYFCVGEMILWEV